MIVRTTIRSNASYPSDILAREARAVFAETLPPLHFSASVHQRGDRIKIMGHVEHQDFVVAALCYVYRLAPGWERICRQYAEDLSQWIYVP
jgi:hypothetical protein